MKIKEQFVQEEVKITVKGKGLNGILTIPSREEPHPAVILLHGSDRSGKDNPYYKEHAENLVQSGFSVLRYDGPGWGGQSSNGPGFETLESRTNEAVAVVKYLQSRPDIKSNSVGLWGISQGGWICQMAAAMSNEVAFIIPVSGPGVTPAEQEVYRVEAESREAGFDADEVAKAVLMRRLMNDIVLSEPLYQVINQSESERLGAGPWSDIVESMYGPNPIETATEFQKAFSLLNAIKDETWTKYLHLDQVIPMFENMPPQAWGMVKGQMRAVLEVNPANFLTQVHCPVLAIFGSADTSIPVDKSVFLYQQYLREAGNESVTIKVFPNSSHTIKVDDEYAPGYFETIKNWLINLYR